MALPRTPDARISIAATACVLVLLPVLSAAGTPDVAKDAVTECQNGSCADPTCPAGSVPHATEGNFTCVCDGDRCARPACGGREPQLLHKATGQPGDCCDVFECPSVEGANFLCEWNNELKKNGTVWPKDECTVCRCEDGIVVCTEKEVCPDIPSSCPEPYIPKGKCCPVCLSDTPRCVVHSKSRVMENGERWQENPCTACVCTDGKKECWSFTCEIKCSNPKYMENECCPICEDNEPAHTASHCPSLNCSLYCPSGFKQNEIGCPICECEQSTDEGTEAPPTETEGHFEDNELVDEDNEEEDEEGDEIIDEDEELYPVEEAQENMCRTLSGDLYEDGKMWSDGCHQCYCHSGLEMCNLIKCPIIKCDHPVFHPSRDCCPHCEDNAKDQSQHQPTAGCFTVDGVYHMEGEIWSLNKCTKCLCYSGQVMCKAEECAPTPCLNPVFQNDKCCSYCPNFTLPLSEHKEPCLANGRNHGESWREHNCNSCICNSGKVECFPEKCSETHCELAVLVKNQCCPICLDNRLTGACTVGNVTYNSEEEWDEDDCRRCKCGNGIKFCYKETCSKKCLNTKTMSLCCSTCEGNSNGGSPSEGQSFDEKTYLIILGLLFSLVAAMAFYIMWQCYRKKQYKLGSLKSCSSTAYNNYMHRDSFAPPRYSAADRQSKCEPCHYKYVPTYDTTQFSDFVKSPSFGASEKTALAPV